MPLHKWLQAIHLHLLVTRRASAPIRLHRIFEITYKTAWFLCHRIREAMRSGDLTPMGGAARLLRRTKPTSVARRASRRAVAAGHKNIVLTLVERGGHARSFHIDERSRCTTLFRSSTRTSPGKAQLMTDEASHYVSVGKEFAAMRSVKHSARRIWARRSPHQHGRRLLFDFKRGMKGVYQHCSEQHLHRYLAEFDFRY